jgi:hypothetical protein
MKHGSMTHDFTGRKIKKKKPTGEVYSKYTRPAFAERTVPNGPVRRDEGAVYKSVDLGSPTVCEAPEKKEYTGTLVVGIATMHKSNAVPVINQEQATDIANMRRS